MVVKEGDTLDVLVDERGSETVVVELAGAVDTGAPTVSIESRGRPSFRVMHSQSVFGLLGTESGSEMCWALLWEIVGSTQVARWITGSVPRDESFWA